MIELNDWLSINKTSGEGNSEITLTALPYQMTGERKTSITIKTSTKQSIVNIVQKEEIEYVFTPYKTLISSEWRGANKTVDVYTNYENLTFEAPDWVDIAVERNGNLYTYAVSFQPNFTTSKRFGKLVIKNSDKTFAPIVLAQGIESEENKVIYIISDTRNIKDGDEIKFQHEWDISDYLYVCCYYSNQEIEWVVDNLCSNYTAVKAVSFPPSVTRINSSFRNCYDLRSVDMYDNVEYIGNSCFFGCNDITHIDLPSNLKEIAQSAFSGCNLTSISFPSSLRTIGNSAFSGVKTLKELVFPPDSQLNAIGVTAFFECYGLTEINLPSSLEGLYEGAFEDCVNLKTVNFPSDSNLMTIDDDAFRGCAELKEFRMPSGVFQVGNYVFKGCWELEYFELYENGIQLGISIFDTYSVLAKLNKIKILPSTGEKPIIDNETFKNIQEGGILEYPQGSDYSDWLSSNQFYLGYYNWIGVPY